VTFLRGRPPIAFSLEILVRRAKAANFENTISDSFCTSYVLKGRARRARYLEYSSSKCQKCRLDFKDESRLLQNSHWLLAKFSKLPNFEMAQSLNFGGVTEPQNRGREDLRASREVTLQKQSYTNVWTIRPQNSYRVKFNSLTKQVPKIKDIQVLRIRLVKDNSYKVKVKGS
jgi:hypothetical protein